MSRLYDLVGIGSPLLDCVARVDDGFLDLHKISKGHMALIDLEALSAVKAVLKIEKEVAGGACANSIVGAASLGSKTAFIGRLGDDESGKKFITDLEAQSVDFAGKIVSASTGICLTLITPDAQRSMQTALGASAQLALEDIDLPLIEQTKILYLEGYLWDLPSARKAALRAAQYARIKNVLVALNLSDALCVERHLDEFRKFASEDVDILIANEEEICAFHQLSDFASAKERTLKLGLSYGALTCNAQGAVVFEKERHVEIAAELVQHPLDSTGAGDLFAAGFLSGLAASKDIETCGKQGVSLAAQIIQTYGARL